MCIRDSLWISANSSRLKEFKKSAIFSLRPVQISCVEQFLDLMQYFLSFEHHTRIKSNSKISTTSLTDIFDGCLERIYPPCMPRIAVSIPAVFNGITIRPVSYTHLTLPTIL